MTALQSYNEILRKAILQRRSIIYINTDDYYSEEHRIKNILINDDILSEIDDANINTWSLDLGQQRLFSSPSNNIDSSLTLDIIIKRIITDDIPRILIIRGLYHYFGGYNPNLCEDPGGISTLLYEFYNINEEKVTEERSIIIIESPKFNSPLELNSCLYTIEPPYPDEDDILDELGLNRIKYSENEDGEMEYYFVMPDKTEILLDIDENLPLPTKKYIFHTTFFECPYFVFEENKKKLLSIFKGMRIREIRTMLSYKNYEIQNVNIDTFREHKEQMVRDSGLLKVEKVSTGYEKNVGDIDGLMSYITREKTIIDNRVHYNPNLPKPKGVLLVGPPGCGKSETSKAIASKLDMPLYSLDMGRLLGGLMGASEHNFENAIAIAEAAQPCVLRIDEIEKAFAGSGVNDNDQTLTRIVGFFLTWMQERRSMVYIVATANNLEQLRPEFLRKGRWDEIFYLSYPKADGMIKIIESCKNRYHIEFDNEQAIRKGVNSFYTRFPKITVSGAEIYDIIQQIYKESFQKDPLGQDKIISSRIFLDKLELLSKKITDANIDKMVDMEILDIKKDLIVRRQGRSTRTAVANAVKKKYSATKIAKMIEDELSSIVISNILSGKPTIQPDTEKKIRKVLEKKYNSEALINDEIVDLEINTLLQNPTLDQEQEDNLRTVLYKKYEDVNSEESYKAKGYKSASSWTFNNETI